MFDFCFLIFLKGIAQFSSLQPRWICFLSQCWNSM